MRATVARAVVLGGVLLAAAGCANGKAIDEIRQTALAAKSTAEGAMATAQEAKRTADQALTEARSAHGTADDARSLAQQALTEARNAQAAAARADEKADRMFQKAVGK
jgi:Alanine-zipper, major outer membrane lipoprotein